MIVEADPYRALVNNQPDKTPEWEHPLRVAAAAEAAAKAALEPVVLGPGNLGYEQPVDPRYIDSRPNPLANTVAKRFY